MGWLTSLMQSLAFPGAPVRHTRSSSGDFSTPPSRTIYPRELHFTRNAKMASWHLSEADVKDVFYHGGVIVKRNMMVKKYNGYEISLYYFQDKQTLQFVITSAWKRDRL